MGRKEGTFGIGIYFWKTAKSFKMKKFKIIVFLFTLFIWNHSTAQLITFDDQGHFDEQSLPNPYTILNGGETFSFTIANGGNPHQYSSADAFCGNALSGHLRAGTVQATSWTIATQSGNEINLGTIRFDNIFTCFSFTYNLTIEGFKDGGSTGVQALTVTGSNTTFTSNASFDDVDEIVITSSDLGYLGIDNINWTLVGLPVELVSFLGSVESDKVNLNWSTATELNNNGFKIMHSLDATDWDQIGFVEGIGTSTQMNHYSFEHTIRGEEMHYYRLIQQDFDGTENFSDIISLKQDLNSKNRIQLVPNPSFNHSSYLIIDGKVTSVVVLDELGRNVNSDFNAATNYLSVPEIEIGMVIVCATLATGEVRISNWMLR